MISTKSDARVESIDVYDEEDIPVDELDWAIVEDIARAYEGEFYLPLTDEEQTYWEEQKDDWFPSTRSTAARNSLDFWIKQPEIEGNGLRGGFEAQCHQNPVEIQEGDVADLSIRVFQDVVEEVEPRLEEFDSEEDSDFSSELDHTGEKNYVMSAVAPDETASFRYVHENGSWKPMDEVEGSGPVRGVEMYMKPKSYGKKRWRVRETDLVKPDGEWKARYSWSEDPTPETEEVHQTITEVVDIYRKEFPSLKYTLFASGCEGRMTEGSDIEHSIVINVEDLGLDDNKEVHDDPKVRAKLRHLRKQITSDIILSINEDLDISMGYGYSATRDEGTEYGFNRKSHSGQDSRIVFRDEGSELVEEYDEYLETNGLIRRHPTRK